MQVIFYMSLNKLGEHATRACFYKLLTNRADTATIVAVVVGPAAVIVVVVEEQVVREVAVADAQRTRPVGAVRPSVVELGTEAGTRSRQEDAVAVRAGNIMSSDSVV